MKIKNTRVYGLEESIIRSGYPMQVGEPVTLPDEKTKWISKIEWDIQKTGENKDLNRAEKLAKVPSGTGHDNFLKGIIVQCDLQYPEYFSPQLQRYSWVDIVSSQSKMHKIMSKHLTQEDFTGSVPNDYIEFLNRNIDDKCFRKVINCLPSGYLKWMGISTNYLQLKTIYNQRKNHKLEEWRDFCNWIKELPLANELIINDNDKKKD